MKKTIILAAALLAFSASLAPATETRLTTMGENFDVLMDDDNIWLYPSTLLSYPDHVIGEIADGTFYKAGGNWGVGESVVGAYFNATPYHVWDGKEGHDMDQRIDLLYGRNFAALPLGIRLSLWGDGSKRESSFESGNDYDHSYKRFEFSAGATLMDGALDVSAAFGKTSFTRDEVDEIDGIYRNWTAFESDGGSDLDLRARYRMTFNKQWTLVPHVALTKSSFDVAANDWEEGVTYTQVSEEFSTSEVVLGVGTNFRPSETVMTVTDLGVRFESTTEDYSYYNGPDDADPWTENYEFKPNYVPYFKMGLEGKVTNWLDIRLGAVSEWYSSEGTSAGPADEVTYTGYGVNARTYLGAGFHFGDLHIDAQLEAAFLNNGPHFVTGNSTEDWASRVALRYDFGS